MEPKNDDARNGAGAEVDGCWRAKSTLENAGFNPTPLSVLIASNLQGQRAASNCLEALKSHYADPDSLYLALKSLLADSQDSENLAAIRGWCRVLQKQIEKGQA